MKQKLFFPSEDELLASLKRVGDYFAERNIYDIYTNSKIYELLIADYLDHQIVDGHRGTPDAIDVNNHFYEYKHYKLSSSNHSWTFNDFSPQTMETLAHYWAVIFAVIDDGPAIPHLQEYYWVPAKRTAAFLWERTPDITNQRHMINIRPSQIEEQQLGRYVHKIPPVRRLHPALEEAFQSARQLESLTGISGLLTSNKLWELLVARQLGHRLNPAQKAHDAFDEKERTYEYKVSRNESWTFQDISERVLNKYLTDQEIILAVVRKGAFRVQEIYHCRPDAMVALLREKLRKKDQRRGTEGRRQISLGLNDLRRLRKDGAIQYELCSIWD